ncbi:MAG: glycosyltransferase family 4 protein [Candidatus Methylumidiphilus sp.]
MISDKKTKIIWLIPGFIYRPELPNFAHRFEALSDKYEGEIYSCIRRDEFQEFKIGSFMFRGAKIPQASWYGTSLPFIKHVLRHAFSYHRANKIDVIICYDPLFTGFIGAFLKRFFGCKLVVEINTTDFREALRLFGGLGIGTKVKIVVGSLMRRFSLWSADGIKLLTEGQRKTLDLRYKEKKIFCYHDFVPTNYFSDATGRVEKYILFAGYPFYLKGVDTLIRAFEMITDQFPDFELRLIGHRLEEEAQRCLGICHNRVKFYKGMHFDEIHQHILNCYCFVLPSRTEGMGRVLIEAMASGKPIIGSLVGGIPDLIEDGNNGFLFQPEDIDDLAKKLAQLLSDPQLAHDIGLRGKSIVEEKFSAEKYIHYFHKMIAEVCSH